jgi:hypothetical protein
MCTVYYIQQHVNRVGDCDEFVTVISISISSSVDWQREISVDSAMINVQSSSSWPQLYSHVPEKCKRKCSFFLNILKFIYFDLSQLNFTCY